MALRFPAGFLKLIEIEFCFTFNTLLFFKNPTDFQQTKKNQSQIKEMRKHAFVLNFRLSYTRLSINCGLRVIGKFLLKKKE